MRHEFTSLLAEALTFVGIFAAGYVAASLAASGVRTDDEDDK
jgi:hypothetical protein